MIDKNKTEIINQKEEVISSKGLIDLIAPIVDLPKNKVKEVLDIFVEQIQNELKKGTKVRITNLGNLKKVFKEAREGVNFITHEPMMIEAKNVVRFKIAKELKETLNK